MDVCLYGIFIVIVYWFWIIYGFRGFIIFGEFVFDNLVVKVVEVCN